MTSGEDKKKPKRKRRLIILGILAGVFVLCLIIGLIYNATPQGKAASTERALIKAAEPTETQNKTETLVPTSTTEPTEVVEPIVEDETIYVVINPTTLWESLGSEDPEQEGLRELDIGVKLRPADGAEDLYCVEDVVYDIPITFCKVEVIESGETGWVNEKWIELE